MSDRLKNKVALVTGGSSGIGRAAAQLFAREGAKVVIADIDVKGGEETLQTIREAGGEAHFVRTDVSKAADVEALINKVIEINGRLDCAYNNAAIFGELLSVVDHTEETWDRAVETNLKGTWLCMKYEIPQMLEQLFELRPEVEATFIAQAPMGRIAAPEEVAEGALWLCSDASSFVTGHVLAVDGGFLAR